MSVVVIATLWPIAEKRAEVVAALGESIPDVHAEEGCELYALHENEDRLVYVEQWASAELLKAHSIGAALAKVNPKLEGLLAKPTEVVVVSPLPFGDARKGALRA